MKKGYYFVAKYVKNGITRICTGTQETIEGYFNFVSAGNFIAKEHNVDFKDVIVTFWSEINSVMLDKYKKTLSVFSGQYAGEPTQYYDVYKKYNG